MGCPGGSRSLGWNDDDEATAKVMAEKAGMDAEIARKVIRATPRLDHTIDEATVATYEPPML